MNIPTRITIKSGLDELYFRFTIPDTQFNIPPIKGDPIDFSGNNWVARAIVQYYHHLVGNNNGSIICCVIDVPDVIETFDLFKDTFTITDVETSEAKPPSYYLAYRTLIKLWGSKVYVHNDDYQMALAELIRASLIAGGYSNDTHKQIELIHRLIIEHKQRGFNNSYSLLDLLKAWDRETGLCQAIAIAYPQTIIETARRLFSNIKSVPFNKLPVCVRDVPVLSPDVVALELQKRAGVVREELQRIEDMKFVSQETMSRVINY